MAEEGRGRAPLANWTEALAPEPPENLPGQGEADEAGRGTGSGFILGPKGLQDHPDRSNARRQTAPSGRAWPESVILVGDCVSPPFGW